jgi:hypothetical protein
MNRSIGRSLFLNILDRGISDQAIYQVTYGKLAKLGRLGWALSYYKKKHPL